MEKTDAAKPKTKTAAKAAATSEAAVQAAPRKTVSRTKKDPQISAEIRHRMIADAAYYRAKKFGSAGSGDDLVHWLAAETEIDAMLKKGEMSS